MKKYNKGVIVGKFYPPHKGHHFLINTGLQNCDELTVIVCARHDQSIPGDLREAWIKEIHPDAKVILADDNIPEGQSAEDYSKAWADYTVKLLGFVPDVAFSSEEYGERWTKYIGCEHFLVDINRLKIPCSGTMVRSDPMKYLDFLEPCVRNYFIKKYAL
jgi:HTH-type transcriptional repressor of NAD biosynthesis genes